MPNSNLAIPSQVRIPLQYFDGPTAQPLLITAGGQCFCVGGLTKVEQLAGMIAAAVMHRDGNGIDTFMSAEHAVDFAECILAECQRRAKEKQQEQAT